MCRFVLVRKGLSFIQRCDLVTLVQRNFVEHKGVVETTEVCDEEDTLAVDARVKRDSGLLAAKPGHGSRLGIVAHVCQ